jgi:hypothetical protein
VLDDVYEEITIPRSQRSADATSLNAYQRLNGDKEVVGTMIVVDTTGSFISDSFHEQLTADLLSYKALEAKSEASDCDQPYQLFRGRFVDDPVRENRLYVSYVFASYRLSDYRISYVSDREKDNKIREKIFKGWGCIPEVEE